MHAVPPKHFFHRVHLMSRAITDLKHDRDKHVGALSVAVDHNSAKQGQLTGWAHPLRILRDQKYEFLYDLVHLVGEETHLILTFYVDLVDFAH